MQIYKITHADLYTNTSLYSRISHEPKEDVIRNINDLYVLGNTHAAYSRQMLINSLNYLQGFSCNKKD